jgi:hypothetical protein
MISCPKKLAGSHPFVDAWNKGVDYWRSLELLPGSGYAIRRKPNGYQLILDRTPPGGSTGQFHPFKIYNVPAGNCPPADPANGYDPKVDAWRTFQIRDGIFTGYQPKYYAGVGANGNGANALESTVLYGTDGGNFGVDENGFPNIVGDFQNSSTQRPIGYTNSGAGVTPGQVVYVGNGGSSGVDMVTANKALGVCTWVLNAQQDDWGSVNAVWWIDISDTTAGQLPVIQIKCAMFSAAINDSTGRSQNPLNGTANQIPIGIAIPSDYLYYPDDYQDLVDFQYQYDHLHLWQPADNQRFLGDWDSDGLSGQVFYPGDTLTAAGGYYAHDGTGIETVSPAVDSVNWYTLATP